MPARSSVYRSALCLMSMHPWDVCYTLMILIGREFTLTHNSTHTVNCLVQPRKSLLAGYGSYHPRTSAVNSTGKPWSHRSADQCFLFQNQINYFLDTLIQQKYFQIMKINNFWGELTDISAKKEALALTTDYVNQLQDFNNWLAHW